MSNEEAIHKCARLIHVAVKAINDAHGENTLDFEGNRASIEAGIRRVIGNPNETPGENHRAWLDYKVQDGWVYGPNKDPVAKTHPCMVPFEDLPPIQQCKDMVFLYIVREFFDL